MLESELDLVVAGTKKGVLMVESEAKELTEDTMLGAVNFGHEKMQVIITAIEELVADANISQIDWTPPVSNNQAYEEFFEKYPSSTNMFVPNERLKIDTNLLSASILIFSNLFIISG